MCSAISQASYVILSSIIKGLCTKRSEVPGDIINIIDKTDQDWWSGELNGTVGIFPASYVQETS